ncbi:MAG: hypothetical protein HZC02_01990 [Candidatus Levybacteria bacterium]|nr:hypothetical protein [Candidatus Levybacteria bacterium]
MDTRDEELFSGFVQYVGPADRLGLTEEQFDALKSLAVSISSDMMSALMKFEEGLSAPKSFLGKLLAGFTENKTYLDLLESEDCLLGPEWRSNHAVVVLIYDTDEEEYFLDLYASNLRLLMESLRKQFSGQLGDWRPDDTVVFTPATKGA